jgi:beta-galactosidase
LPKVRIADYKIYLDSTPIPLIGGEVHYWRLAPQNWCGILERAREMGLEVISTYVCWDYHR